MSQKKVLLVDSISTNRDFKTKEEATTASGQLLLENGYIEKEYIDSMLEKLDTQLFATFIGNGVAIPHGMSSGSVHVLHTGISVIQVPEGVSWGEEIAYIIVGIAANSDEHMNVLSALATLLKMKKMLRNFGKKHQLKIFLIYYLNHYEACCSLWCWKYR